MRDLLDRHRGTLASLFALILPLFLLYAHGRKERRTTVVEYALMRASAPVQSTASRMLGGVERMWAGYVSLVDLGEENARLEDKVQILTAEALRAKELAHENQRLREMLEFRRARPELRGLGAHVIGLDVSPYARVVRIALDAGLRDGVEEKCQKLVY